LSGGDFVLDSLRLYQLNANHDYVTPHFFRETELISQGEALNKFTFYLSIYYGT